MKILSEMLDDFFTYKLFNYEEINQNLHEAGLSEKVILVEKMIDVYPFGKAVYDKRMYGEPALFDVTFAGHLDGIKEILSSFYPETSAMSESEIDDFIMGNFTFLGGAEGALLEKGISSYSKNDMQKEFSSIDANLWWENHNAKEKA